ncbi:YheC/YheD family protein [Neobacillus sp. DY30]|uniref:YheC/YheD family protein n=1 Tax=Neobacillus sp. DY30 TaxID=3047871 RepID=UPI0024C01F92|nr:YheC/YheD family protein [Neobacillus sp. DY30]WHY02038.1 YheC/YheD family protein [Neobacillus sp. DY30]
MGVSFGKWTKHKLMSKDERLSSYLPDTQYLTKSSLNIMLEKYNQIMVKPCFGFQGRGIIQLSSLSDEVFVLHIERSKTFINVKENIYDYLKENHFPRKRQRYIVQQFIPLATINNNPFDVRVMVQRKKDSLEWVVTGKLAKVAANNFVVTNVAKALLPVEVAIEKSLVNNEKIKDIVAELEEVSLLIAQQLTKSYTNKRVYGIDLGIDTEGKVWIIEANLRPAVSMFKLLNDGSYETIKSYKKG